MVLVGWSFAVSMLLAGLLFADSNPEGWVLLLGCMDVVVRNLQMFVDQALCVCCSCRNMHPVIEVPVYLSARCL